MRTVFDFLVWWYWLTLVWQLLFNSGRVGECFIVSSVLHASFCIFIALLFCINHFRYTSVKLLAVWSFARRWWWKAGRSQRSLFSFWVVVMFFSIPTDVPLAKGWSGQLENKWSQNFTFHIPQHSGVTRCDNWYHVSDTTPSQLHNNLMICGKT